LGLRGRLRRLERDAEKEMIVIEQKGGQPKKIARAPSRYRAYPSRGRRSGSGGHRASPGATLVVVQDVRLLIPGILAAGVLWQAWASADVQKRPFPRFLDIFGHGGRGVCRVGTRKSPCPPDVRLAP
jgi:hypothetical protein